MTPKPLTLLLIFAALAGLMALLAAWRGPGRPRPREATAAQVAACRYLGTVTGTSGYGKPAAWEPLARADAAVKAAALGATHLVWLEAVPRGAFNGDVTAGAYDCNG